MRNPIIEFRVVSALALVVAILLPMMCHASSPRHRDLFVATSGSDSNDGSQAHPWRTLAHAATSVKPGVTVHVAPGIYLGRVVTTVSGDGAARIRFVSDTQGGAKLRSAGSTATWTNMGDYVDIVGFDVSGDGRIGVLNYGSFVRIMGNYVHDIPADGCTGDGGAGIDNANYKAIGNDIIGNVVQRIGTGRCNRVHGIYQSNLKGRIWNNIVCCSSGWGIHLWHAASDISVANNLVFQNQSGGIVVGADRPTLRNDRTIVANNLVIYNRVGIKEYGSTGSGNRYLSNLIFGNWDGAISLLTGTQRATLARDPKLADYKPDGSGNYRPSSASPTIGAGTRESAPDRTIDGAIRPRDLPLDIGPYQYGASGASWPWY